MLAHSLNPVVNIPRGISPGRSITEGSRITPSQKREPEGNAEKRGEEKRARRTGLGSTGQARRFRFSSVIRTESYIISLSSTLYMRLRSIFCLFAPLNGGAGFDSVKPLAGFRSPAAFSVLAYRSGYLCRIIRD